LSGGVRDPGGVTVRADDVLVKPLLRGWLHLVCFFLAVPTGAWVIASATTTVARVGATVYAIGLTALFGVSGAYHRGRWSPAWRRRMQRADHATIFVMIAGSYTPVCLLVIRGAAALAMLAVVWAAAVTGAVLSFLPGRRLAYVANGLYIAMGWSVVLAVPQLVARLEGHQLVLLVVGGVLFTAGAVALFTRWPDPFPRVLGYHEVWHVMVVAAVICHLVVISGIVRSAAPA
jgi:hemolysin III